MNASRYLSPWKEGDLPGPPRPGWRLWLALLGPGVLLAGASVGSGEWLVGPAVSAQYGATLLWVATISIVVQVFTNLEFMRYTLYCGEPVMVGYFRSWPGPVFWTCVYAVLDISSIWPYNASNAAVPLAAAILGHLPGAGAVSVLGLTVSESQLVKTLGYVIFFAAFLPLIFGGTVYKMLERIMTFKLIVVLGYLTFVAIFMVSPRNAQEVATGFVRFGSVPLRAETVIAGRHFTLTERDDATSYMVKGTLENAQPLVTLFSVNRQGVIESYPLGSRVPPELERRRTQLVERATRLGEGDHFYIQDSKDGVTVTAKGEIAADRSWQPEQLIVMHDNVAQSYPSLDDVPEPAASRLRALLTNEGLERVNFFGYVAKNGRIPDLDWAMIAAFAAIAGTGGLTNTLFSNYARDKGWGMGARVGAIPSAVGGLHISLSHVGQTFPLTENNRRSWRGWFRYIVRDQVAIWMVCCFVGMALPCMMSLEFIRNAPVAGDRVAAMTAEGIAERHPDYRYFLWTATLLCGFLILAPGQIVSGDQIARRWTDIIWTCNAQAQRLRGNQVKYIYYGILGIYAVWGTVALAILDPLQILKVGTIMQNVGLGFTALHALYINRTLLPRELRPNRLMQLGLIGCGVFYCSITLIVLLTL